MNGLMQSLRALARLKPAQKRLTQSQLRAKRREEEMKRMQEFNAKKREKALQREIEKGSRKGMVLGKPLKKKKSALSLSHTSDGACGPVVLCGGALCHAGVKLWPR